MYMIKLIDKAESYNKRVLELAKCMRACVDNTHTHTCGVNVRKEAIPSSCCVYSSSGPGVFPEIDGYINRCF